MNSLYLLNEAIGTTVLDAFKAGMSELIVVKDSADKNDSFWGHSSIYELAIWQILWADPNSAEASNNITKFAEQVKKHPTNISTVEVLDAEFPDSCNAFLGFNFGASVPADRQVGDEHTFEQFKQQCLWGDVSYRNLWERRKELFPDLSLCDGVEQQIAGIGESKQFKEIVDTLKILNKVAKDWIAGDFNYRKTKEGFHLDISPESKLTLDNYSNERTFTLPDKNRVVFDLHVKVHDLRFHIYPDNKTWTLYVGYIGSHLQTWTG